MKDDQASDKLLLAARKAILELAESRMGSAAPPDQGTHQLTLRRNEQAILVQLDSKPAPETTIDGRANSDTTAWYFRSEEALRIPRGEIVREGWEWIVDGVD